MDLVEEASIQALLDGVGYVGWDKRAGYEILKPGTQIHLAPRLIQPSLRIGTIDDVGVQRGQLATNVAILETTSGVA